MYFPEQFFFDNLLFYIGYFIFVDICYLNNLSGSVASYGSTSVCINLFAHGHEDVCHFVCFCISEAFLQTFVP